MHQPENESYTVGIGLTDRCSANCPQCYSRPTGDYHELDFDAILQLLKAVPVQSINFGTGESILYPRFVELVHLLSGRGIPLAVTTNGSTVQNLSDADLRLFHDIDFSIDFPDEARNDDWRGIGSYRMVMRGIERCLALGVEASLVTCLMKQNCADMGKLARLAVKLGLNLRVNIYKPVFSREYQPSYEEFWSAVKDLADIAYFTACSEPIVNAAIGNLQGPKGSPCGRMSFRVHPDGTAVSCVYLQNTGVTIEKLTSHFNEAREILRSDLQPPLPSICLSCEHLDVCRGGCASRRLLNHADQPDEYCFVVRQDQPQIQARWKASKGLVHENYLCTMIFCR
ncbi:MAG TPA: radical SAM protein [bacterium]|jgi:radical SAM protein with 4Fe4S-binding SPASM domain